VKEKKIFFVFQWNEPTYTYYFSKLNQSRRTDHAKEMVLIEEFGKYIPKYFKTFFKILFFWGISHIFAQISRSLYSIIVVWTFNGEHGHSLLRRFI
jgi:hypothetical protein